MRESKGVKVDEGGGERERERVRESACVWWKRQRETVREIERKAVRRR